MPWSLHRYQQTGDLHFVTFSCYRRRPLLRSAASRDVRRHRLTGPDGVVEIEFDWTARKRERMGIFPTVRMRPGEDSPILSPETREG